MSLDSDVVNDIAAELAIEPAFIEKDWFSIQVLKGLSEHSHNKVKTIFSGGTSLSKGYGVIQRFSEDLDFRCQYLVDDTSNQKRKFRRSYRESVIKTIFSIQDIRLDESKINKASNYFKFPLSYPQKTENHSSLRPHLEIEFSFTQPKLDPTVRPIQSIISNFMGNEPETSILCMSPLEVGADKLSALAWRVLKRDRKASNDDPAIIRHLHDLASLKPIINNEVDQFRNIAAASFEDDQRTGKRQTDYSFHESLKRVLSTLENDSEYKEEYSRFVDAMSFADDVDNIDFELAKNDFAQLTTYFE